MIDLVEVPAEQTTAATNLVLCLIASAGILTLHRLRRHDAWKTAIWSAAFTSLLVASAAAAAGHGLKLSPGVYATAWTLSYLSLALMIACPVVGVTHDLWGAPASRRAAPVMATIAVLFFVVIRSDSAFLVIILYEAVFMGLTLLGYGYLALIRRRTGSGLISTGLLVTLLAAVVQATHIVPQIRLVWVFDHNGHYHLVQAVGLILLILGLRAALLAERPTAVAAMPRPRGRLTHAPPAE